MAKQVAVCACVSTGEQTPDNRLKGLRAVTERMGWRIAVQLIDHGIGAKGLGIDVCAVQRLVHGSAPLLLP